MTSKEKFPKIEHDTRLVKKGTRFFLAVPITHPEPKKKLNGQIVALDPGIRSFQTTYDTTGTSYSFGESDILKIDSHSRIASRLRSGIKKNGKKEKSTKSMRRRAQKIENKIKNHMNDMHRKISRFLCEKYDTIILPKFSVREMAQRRDMFGNWKRKINRDTTRRLYRWGHFSFRSLLSSKGEQTGTKVVIATEEWTSKTCTNCLKINWKLGSNKVFRCSCCNLIIDRDINGARNILLKNWELAGISLVPKRVIRINHSVPAPARTT